MNQIKEIFGEKLLTLCHYYIGNSKKIGIVVSKVEFSDIMNLKKITKTPAQIPLILTKHELETSTDVFPLEFLNLKKTYEIISGVNLFKNIKIQKKHVRMQLELEFRSKLIHLRQEFLILNSKSDLKKLLKSAINVLAPIFHGLLYLKGNDEKYDSLGDYIDKLKELYNVDFGIVEKIRNDKFDNNVNNDITELMELLSVLSDVVDQIKC